MHSEPAFIAERREAGQHAELALLRLKRPKPERSLPESEEALGDVVAGMAPKPVDPADEHPLCAKSLHSHSPIADRRKLTSLPLLSTVYSPQMPLNLRQQASGETI